MTRSDARKKIAEQRLAAIRPTRPIRVTKSGLDWLTYCHEHDLTMWSGSQDDAYLWACGHALLHHPKRSAA